MQSSGKRRLHVATPTNLSSHVKKWTSSQWTSSSVAHLPTKLYTDTIRHKVVVIERLAEGGFACAYNNDTSRRYWGTGMTKRRKHWITLPLRSRVINRFHWTTTSKQTTCVLGRSTVQKKSLKVHHINQIRTGG